MISKKISVIFPLEEDERKEFRVTVSRETVLFLTGRKIFPWLISPGPIQESKKLAPRTSTRTVSAEHEDRFSDIEFPLPPSPEQTIMGNSIGLDSVSRNVGSSIGCVCTSRESKLFLPPRLDVDQHDADDENGHLLQTLTKTLREYEHVDNRLMKIGGALDKLTVTMQAMEWMHEQYSQDEVTPIVAQALGGCGGRGMPPLARERFGRAICRFGDNRGLELEEKWIHLALDGKGSAWMGREERMMATEDLFPEVVEVGVGNGFFGICFPWLWRWESGTVFWERIARPAISYNCSSLRCHLMHSSNNVSVI